MLDCLITSNLSFSIRTHIFKIFKYVIISELFKVFRQTDVSGYHTKKPNEINRMKSRERVIKDIRFYKIKQKDFTGDFNGIIGNVYHITEDTNSIGQRIARKLNELQFISGEFDHIYINFTGNIKHGELVESEKFLDKRIKYVD